MILTEVFVEKSAGDISGGVEMVTLIRESGNGQGQSRTETKSIPAKTNFAGEGPLGMGRFIASALFSGTKLPSSMLVTVHEDDGASSGDDGVCSVRITTAFSTEGTRMRCVRESVNGRAIEWIVNVRVSEILPVP